MGEAIYSRVYLTPPTSWTLSGPSDPQRLECLFELLCTGRGGDSERHRNPGLLDRAWDSGRWLVVDDGWMSDMINTWMTPEQVL